jgi:hypothetical protein
MAMGLVRLAGLLALLLASAAPALGTGQLILLDRSGSMAKYYQSGLVAETAQRFNSVMQAHDLGPASVGVFNDHVEIVKDLGTVSASGPTYLDAAIEYAVKQHYTLVWMLTDNVQHRVGEEEGQTAVFYDKLKQDAVRRVVIFPLKQRPGLAGVVVYALLLSDGEDAAEAFRQETEEFARLTSGTVLLPMKPLDRDTIETVFIEDPADKGRPRPIYAEGSVVRESVKLKFRSRFEHLKIIKSEIVNPRVSPEFSRASLLKFEQEDIQIDPTVVEELDPKGETVQVYTVSVNMGRIRLKRDPISLWKAALSNPIEDVSLELSFSINVPKENFQFTEAFLRDYSARTTEEAKAGGKIYDLDALPLLVAENRTSIGVPHRPKIRVQYPWWLVFIFPGFPILSVVTLGVLGVFVWRKASSLASGGARWGVEVAAPEGARGQVQGGWVTVTTGGRVTRLGRLKGGNFVPAAGVAPAGEQPLKEGLPLKLTHRKNEFSLIFRKTPGPGAPGGEEKKRDVKKREVKI